MKLGGKTRMIIPPELGPPVSYYFLLIPSFIQQHSFLKSSFIAFGSPLLNKLSIWRIDNHHFSRFFMFLLLAVTMLQNLVPQWLMYGQMHQSGRQ
jgi:hypothetical protein